MKKIFLSSILCGVLLASGTNTDNAQIKESDKISNIKRVAVKNEKNIAENKKIKMVQEAIDSLHYTGEALSFLDKGETKKAQKNIELALGKLEVILASKDAPKSLPIDRTISLKEYFGTKESIEETLDKVEDLLEDKKVQVARELLNTLQSEIDITTVSLPLASYPDALKLAAKYIHDNKTEEAKHILAIALQTFDTTIEIIPLPLVKAANFIHLASVSSKDGKKDEAIEYLKYAEDELDIAETLGYISSSNTTYEALHKSIKEIEKEIKGKNKAEKLFDELKSKIKEFKDKIFSNKEK